ncbi:hypothetical protein AB0E74_21365, partial [Streptomyces sp. NPDC030392]|uniref:hypothetical protein n=1 Tax=Streptomyces sp. NPDC030392 TaxID=3155468 RepID=UPI0033F59CBD
PGDWAVRRPHLPPGGWAFEFHNDTYPDSRTGRRPFRPSGRVCLRPSGSPSTPTGRR